MAKGYNRPMGGGGAGQGGMMAQIKKMQEQMAAAQEELAVQTITSSVGGGAVKVTMTGDQHCTAVEIDPEMIKDADAEMLQDLILSGVNQALDDSRKMAEDKMAPLTGGLSGLGF
jgi:nucleoid-associated protein EbfC